MKKKLRSKPAKYNRFSVFDLVNYLLMLLLMATIILPFVHIISVSLSHHDYAVRNAVGLLPKGFTLDTYINVFKNGDFLQAYANTIYYTVVHTVLSLVLTAMAAYALARRRMVGHKLFSIMITITMFFGGGLIPTYMAVSRYGLVAYASSMDQIGPIGRTVADCRALYECIAGYDEKDATTVKREVKSQTGYTGNDGCSACLEKIKGMRFAVPREYFGDGTSKEVREAVEAAAKILVQNGAVVEEVSLPVTEYAVAAYYIIACAEASSNLARFDGVKYGYRASEAESLHELYVNSRSEGFGEEVKRRILMGSFVLSEGYYEEYYLKALKVRRRIRDAFEAVFASYDCILTPTAPTTAPEFGTGPANPLRMYLQDADTVAVNLAGLPAISVPCGVDTNGLPIGLQIIGNAFCEDTLFTAAEAYEMLRGEFPTAWEPGKGR